MHFISIGHACNVKIQINRHIQNSETLFFDWLGTDMQSVILVLQCTNIDELLSYDNIVKVPTQKMTVRIKSLPYCVSIHDFHKFNDDEINNFILKYKRRHVLSTISSCSFLYNSHLRRITIYLK